MKLRIDKTSTLPVYAQLADTVRLAVREGELKVGDAMPTVRQLAVELALNANTVARVYRELSSEGVLRLERGVGTFVASTASPALGAREMRAIEKASDRLVDLARAAEMSPGELYQLLERRWTASSTPLSAEKGTNDVSR